MARRRARDLEGQFISDNPETPNVDEAWEEVPASEGDTPPVSESEVVEVSASEGDAPPVSESEVVEVSAPEPEVAVSETASDAPSTLEPEVAVSEIASDAPSTPEPEVAVLETAPPASEPVVIDHTPAVLELQVGSTGAKPAEKLTKEQIEVSVKEKLSRKTDTPGSNPFIPNNQLEVEVRQIAKDRGFPLSRGTEIGARLLARSRRAGKPNK